MLSKWGQRFSPLSLFAAGEQGGWWDPSDFSTMFQDSAGTTPVTAVGQPVGLIRDKSGRGNHLLQGTAAARPTLQQDASGYFYIQPDGVDDTYATAGNVDFTTTDKILVVAGMRKVSDVSRSCIVRHGTTSVFLLEGPATAGVANFNWRSIGTLTSQVTPTGFAAPISAVLSGQAEISTDTLKLRVSQTEFSAAADQGTGNYSLSQLFVFADNGTVNFFSGRLYSLIVRGTLSSAAQVAQAERYAGSKMGIVL